MSEIIVGVRVRPFNQREVKYNSCNIVKMDTHSNIIYLTQVRQGKVLKDQKPKEFHFDHALWTHDTTSVTTIATQDYTYTKLGRPVLKNVLVGYNACLFAYGQTGSGKTYSMMGYGPEAGVTPRLCEELYQHISDTHAAGATQSEHTEKKSISSTVVTVEASYLEIYNEVVKDLLGDTAKQSSGLKIRQHPKTGVFVEGLKKHTVSSKDAIVKLLDDGQNLRSTAATAMNATSSRSHAVLMLTVTHTTTNTAVHDNGKEVVTIAVKTGKLSLVDLAGSERAASTGAQGDTLKEGSNINKSLSFLGMCLSRLAEIAESGKAGGHIPFRDSSLTFLLSDNLGGNSKTSMLANISPAEINYDETLGTLRFAQVTKKVKNHAIVNENPTAKMIRELRAELEQLRLQLRAHQEKSGYIPKEVRDATSELSSTEEGTMSETTPKMQDMEGASPTRHRDPTSGTDVPLTARTVEGDALVRMLAESEAAALALEEESTEVVLTNASIAFDGVLGDGDEDPLAMTTGKSLFVDWRRPQLVNLCSESSTLVLPIDDGPNDWFVDSAIPTSAFTPLAAQRTHDDTEENGGSCVKNHVDRTAVKRRVTEVVFGVEFVPLLNQATFNYVITVSPSTFADVHRPLSSDEIPLPVVNGQTLDPIATGSAEIPGTLCSYQVRYSQVITHSDRIVLNQIALRVSHSTSLPSMPEFSKVLVDNSQLESLEAFEREKNIQLCCVQEYQELWSSFVEDAPAPSTPTASSPDVDTCLSPRSNAVATAHRSDSAALIAQSLEDDLQASNNTMRQVEEELINNFPITLQEQTEFLDEWRAQKAGGVATGQTVAGGEGEVVVNDYGTAVEEASKSLDDKQMMIENLKKELENASTLRKRRETTMVKFTKEQHDLRKKNEALRLAAKEAADKELAGKQAEAQLKINAKEEADKLRAERDEERRLREEEEAAKTQQLEEEIEAEMSEILEKEMVWHSGVRKLRLPAPSGPRDPTDLRKWKQLASKATNQMPFLYQVMQQIVDDVKLRKEQDDAVRNSSEQFSATCGSVTPQSSEHVHEVVSSPKSIMAFKTSTNGKTELPVDRCGMFFKQNQSGKAFEERFFAIAGRFLYYFLKPDGRERCRGAIYLYGATVARLSPAIERELGRTNCLLLTSPCPRRTTAAGGNSFYLSFGSASDLNMWESWMQAASTPQMPPSMRQRLDEELAEAVANGTRAPPSAVSGSVKIGNAGRFNWKNGASVKQCEHCATGFGFFTGKHHCETCGGIFCVRCCPVTAGGARSCGMCRQYGSKRPDGEGDDFEVLDDDFADADDICLEGPPVSNDG